MKKTDKLFMALILDFIHLNKRQALVLVMCPQQFCYQPKEGNREPLLYHLTADF